jgi:hypothetical protein
MHAPCRYIDSVDTSTKAKQGQQVDALASVHFDTRSALLLARKRGLKQAVRRLLLLRGDIPAALEYSRDVADAQDAVSRVPKSRYRDLWLQYVRIRAAANAPTTVADLQAVCKASEGALAFQDVVTFVSETERGSAEVQEALAANLEAGSAKLQVLQKQFEGFGERMEARRQELERLREERKNASVPPGAKCAACGGILAKKPKNGMPHGAAHLPLHTPACPLHQFGCLFSWSGVQQDNRSCSKC